jgi:IS30 family transposase
VRKMLMLVDREEISRGLAESLEYKEIGLRLGRGLDGIVAWRHDGPYVDPAAAASAAVATALGYHRSSAADRA